MLKFWQTLHETAGMGGGLYIYIAAFLVAAAAMLVFVAAEKRRITVSLTLFVLALLSLLVAAGLEMAGGLDSGYRFARFLYLLLMGLAAVNLSGVLFFRVVLRSARLEPPPILSDLLLACIYVALLLAVLHRSDVNLTGIIATSAVVTAVIGLSLQDTLGNVIGGMILQLDHSIQEGDWVRFDGKEGIVREVRWRHTSIETNDWTTVIIPNSQLMKSVVVVLGRRTGKPQLTRRDINFNVDFRHPPSEVVEIIEQGFREEQIPAVASEPRPNCVMLDYKESYGQYCLRYWLTDWLLDRPTDTAVRARIYTVLNRAGMSPAIPAVANFATVEDSERRQRKHTEEMSRRTAALRGANLFAPLTDQEIGEMAGSLRPAPFSRGETITRQGAVAHWLYVLVRGTAEVRVAAEKGGPSQTLATLGPGNFFGEMGLLTGDPRSATVVAQTDVHCYRLDKDGFLGILKKRPEVAADISVILATRRAELDAVREGLDQAAARLRAQRTQADLLDRIRSFFGLGA
ncbi:MAG: cyclic nucleotide-binding domain-containing protein [Tepidisphaerales bacterium]